MISEERCRSSLVGLSIADLNLATRCHQRVPELMDLVEKAFNRLYLVGSLAEDIATNGKNATLSRVMDVDVLVMGLASNYDASLPRLQSACETLGVKVVGEKTDTYAQMKFIAEVGGVETEIMSLADLERQINHRRKLLQALGLAEIEEDDFQFLVNSDLLTTSSGIVINNGQIMQVFMLPTDRLIVSMNNPSLLWRAEAVDTLDQELLGEFAREYVGAYTRLLYRKVLFQKTPIYDTTFGATEDEVIEKLLTRETIEADISQARMSAVKRISKMIITNPSMSFNLLKNCSLTRLISPKLFDRLSSCGLSDTDFVQVGQITDNQARIVKWLNIVLENAGNRGEIEEELKSRWRLRESGYAQLLPFGGVWIPENLPFTESD